MSDQELKLSIDMTEAREFLDAVAKTASSQFAICRPGDVIFLECDVGFSLEAHEKLATQFAMVLDGTGVRAVMLPKGLRVARIDLKNVPEV